MYWQKAGWVGFLRNSKTLYIGIVHGFPVLQFVPEVHLLLVLQILCDFRFPLHFLILFLDGCEGYCFMNVGVFGNSEGKMVAFVLGGGMVVQWRIR